MTTDNWVVVGRIGAPHGVRGWLKVKSYTEIPEDLFAFQPWRVLRRGVAVPLQVLEHRRAAGQFSVRLDAVEDRDTAEALRGEAVVVAASQLPAPPEGEYYWRDLVGAEVVGPRGSFGHVVKLMETGANDVLVVSDGESERLIPFADPYVAGVAPGRIDVDWEPDW